MRIARSLLFLTTVPHPHRLGVSPTIMGHQTHPMNFGALILHFGTLLWVLGPSTIALSNPYNWFYGENTIPDTKSYDFNGFSVLTNIFIFLNLTIL